MDEKEILSLIEDSIIKGDIEKINSLKQDITDSLNIKSEEIYSAFSNGIEKVRINIKSGSTSIPELLLSIDTFKLGVKIIEESGRSIENKNGVIVIGVVEGDSHDLGKNIVASLLKAYGFDVHDLGKNITIDAFIEAIRVKKPDILALSTMMSTPIENMHRTIQYSRKLYKDIKIIVGGAALDEKLAMELGADGYSETAVTVPDIAMKLLSKSGL